MRLVVLVGASGVGKTTVAGVLSERPMWRGRTHFFDSIGVPSTEEMETEYGGPEGWQEWATHQWVDRLAEAEGSPQLLEGQTRPTFVISAAAQHADLETRVVLLDCSSEVRRRRLTELRGQPELATGRMDCWAAYLTGQAHALGLPVVMTDDKTPEEVAADIESMLGET